MTEAQELMKWNLIKNKKREKKKERTRNGVTAIKKIVKNGAGSI